MFCFGQKYDLYPFKKFRLFGDILSEEKSPSR